jgi:glycosyltransferase involved in cell wall biosynthesis
MIGQAAESVIGQTHENWELIIVDDGSDDDTEAVIAKFKRDKRINYVRKVRGGVCKARNAGLDLAKGDLIAFLDSDNVWDKEFLALLVSAIDLSDADAVYSGLQMQQKGKTIGYRGEVFDYDECLKSNYVDLNTLLLKKSVVGQSRFDETIRRMNDWDFLLNVTRNKKVEYVPFIGVSYSFHERPDQISELEPQIYKKLIQKRHSDRLEETQSMTTRTAFSRISLDVAILLAAPKEKRNEWGDYHYGVGLADAFVSRGHKVHLYYYREQVTGAVPDVTISLRGLTEHSFPSGTIKVIWSISHPDLLTWSQIDSCDILFCASLTWPQMLHWAGKINAFPLLQCVDHKRFFPPAKSIEKDERVLFVGNSRKADRPIVLHADDSGVNLHVYGTNWEGRISPSKVKGEYIPNEKLTEEYAAASIVLNDHWPSMRDFGFVSNRVFDVTASSGVLLSDHVPSIHTVFGRAVTTYRQAEDFSNAIDKAVESTSEIDRNELGAWVNERHSFLNRADEILRRVEDFALVSKNEMVQSKSIERLLGLRGSVKNVKIGLIPQPSGSSMTSSAFIRLVQPLTSEIDDVTVTLTRVYHQEPLQNFDAIIVSRTAFDDLEQAEKFLEQSAKQRIPLVVDVDDSFHLMDEEHPQFDEYKPKVAALNLMMEAADEIWCSTTPLQESLRPRFGDSILFPNSLDPRLWRTYRDLGSSLHRDDDLLEILYAGSITHGNDLDMVMPALDRLSKSTPIRLTTIGITPNVSARPWIRKISPGNNSVYPRYARWLLRQASLFDVGIAPLTDNPFNDFKSDLKILEYCAMGLVPIASATKPYIDSEAIDSQTLCTNSQDWFDRIHELATDREKLRKMKNTVVSKSQFLWEERSAAQTGNRIVERLDLLASPRHL